MSRARTAVALVALTLAAAPVARADSFASLQVGDPVWVQFGSYLSSTATLHWEEFEVSNGFGWPFGPAIPPQHFSYDYAAAPFDAATDEKIEIKSFAFFSNQQHSSIFTTNVFNVFMRAGSGPLSFFGQFYGVSPLCGFAPACVPNCGLASLTCLPLGAGGVGTFFYDPSLGPLHVEMIQTLDLAANVYLDPLFWHDQYAAGGGGLVTRFDGFVAVVPSPEPSTLLLLGTGVLGVVGIGVTRRRRQA